MSKASQPSRGGLNRGGLRAAPKPPPARPPVVPLPAPIVLAPAPPPMPSAARAALLAVGGVAGFVAFVIAVLLIRDSIAVGSYLAKAKAERTDLICQDGRMVHGDGSLLDWIVEDAYFSCANWSTLQAVDQSKTR